ncbi:glucose/sorbosone family PQQ-dependent dehydrogenase [Gallibacterium anatis]|uniref:glucose/sorbosone family PQQ-dependent dehydrogenase n=1 Tax=Gallibacterium anatis TaxID=750 RepID=UPI0039FCC960
MKKLAFAGALFAFAATSASAIDVVSKDGKVDFGSRFEATVLTNNVDGGWEMIWGPKEQLWLTERAGRNIVSIDPKTGEKTVLYHFANAYEKFPHQGVLGLALDPNFDAGEPYAYAAYTYNDGDKKFARIVRLTYDAKANKLGEEKIVLDGIIAGVDHNAGRIKFGPDGKLYYTTGDLGHNQGKHVCDEITSQKLPTAEQVKNHDYSAYNGKSLRINKDGSIPDDNPVIKGVKSHVYTYGHRNPQGLVWVGNNLYSTEQGPSSDDELNKLEAGGNYGWPHVAGFKDDLAYVYANYSAAKNCPNVKFDPNVIPESVPTQKETDYKEPVVDPVKTFFTVNNDYNYTNATCGKLSYICWPTIAPGNAVYYPKDGVIPEFRNSLLLATYKSGSIYQVKMNEDASNVQGDIGKYFTSANRYRNALVSPDTRKIYVVTDNMGNGRQLDDTPTSKMANPGSIIVFEYVGN